MALLRAIRDLDDEKAARVSELPSSATAKTATEPAAAHISSNRRWLWTRSVTFEQARAKVAVRMRCGMEGGEEAC